MMLRQEGALDRSIDRKVRILLRLRKESTNLPVAPPGEGDGGRIEKIEKAHDSDIASQNSQTEEFTNLPIAPAGQDDGPRVGNMEEIIDSDIPSDNSQGVEAVENIKMKEQRGNVYENKGPACSGPGQSRNVIENEYSYAQSAGMLLKTKGVIGNAQLHETSKWPSPLRVSDDARSVR
jgi:hypothetical protein